MLSDWLRNPDFTCYTTATIISFLNKENLKITGYDARFCKEHQQNKENMDNIM